MLYDKVLTDPSRTVFQHLEGRFVRIVALHSSRIFRNRLVSVFTGRDCLVEWTGELPALKRLVATESFDLVISEAKLVEAEFSDLVAAVRRSNVECSILVTNAGPSSSARIVFLSRGADDAISEPVEDEEVEARVRILIGRVLTRRNRYLHCGGLRLDLDGLIAYDRDTALRLTWREWKLAAYFASNRSRTLTFSAALEMLGGDDELTENALAILVSRFRAKVKHLGINIATNKGVGYYLVESSEERPRAGVA